MTTTANRGLLPFDKLNIALCAKQRAEQYVVGHGDRFEGEYDTMLAWMRHTLFTMGGRNWSH